MFWLNFYTEPSTFDILKLRKYIFHFCGDKGVRRVYHHPLKIALTKHLKGLYLYMIN